MKRFNLIILFALCAVSVYPATSISRWFSSSYHDLQVTLRRYSRCVGDLAPFRDQNLNETEYLVRQIKVFLEQANYDNEQLANLTLLMDTICQRSEDNHEYGLSMHIDAAKYNSSNKNGKLNRCKAIDESMDSMYVVFRRAALNKSEPLDFNSINFYPNASNKMAYYNLGDLINMSWIKSDTSIEEVCNITDSVKDYIVSRTRNSTAQDRSQQQHAGVFNTLFDLIDRILEPLLGIQKRLYSDTTNGLQQVYSDLSNRLGNLRSGVGKGFKNTRERISSIFVSSSTSNSTVLSHNATIPLQKISALNVNVTKELTTTTTTTNKPEVIIIR